jgi:hypothetical protein
VEPPLAQLPPAAAHGWVSQRPLEWQYATFGQQSAEALQVVEEQTSHCFLPLQTIVTPMAGQHSPLDVQVCFWIVQPSGPASGTGLPSVPASR